MIAVTFALPAESSDFARLKRDVKILHTGVGRRAVERTLPGFLEQHAPRVLISAGFAGAATNSFHVGDVFIAENFSDAALAAKLPLRKAKLATVSRIADQPDEREASGADAVDMETEFIAEECRRRGVRLLALRAISDTPAARFGVPTDVLFNVERQRTDLAKLLAHMVRHPAAVSRLLRVARQVKSARRALTASLEQVITALRAVA